MSIRRLLSLSSGDVNFKILRTLHDTPMYSKQLVSRLFLKPSTMRTHLQRLRHKNFIDYIKEGNKHYYHIKTPFETPAHELIIATIAMAPSVKKRGEPKDTDLKLDTPHPLLIREQLNYWTTLAAGLYDYLSSRASPYKAFELSNKLDEIKSRIEEYKSY